ncbi:MAG: hypothetical protein ABID71_06145 [Chloroflexota bacterium]
MEFTDDSVLKFMKQYFRDYTDYAQNPGTVQKMHDYFTPDYEFTPFIAGNATVSGRENFLRLMSSHPSSHESLTPDDIMIDLKRRVAVVLLRAELSDSATGEVLVAKSYHVLYRLVTGESGGIRIKKVLFFEEILPPGTPDMGDVFKKDPGIAGLFSG